MLKVDPKKNMLFNPEESIDFNGNTGPFIQYTFTRIQSILRKSKEKNISIKSDISVDSLSVKEKDIVKRISLFPGTVKEAGDHYSPAIIANYCYELVKEYNQFYHDHSILAEADEDKRNFRLLLSAMVGDVVKKGMNMLGIEMPERM